MPHLEAAFVLFVGPTMKKFHDRDLPCDEWAFAKALSYTSSFVHKGWLGIELLNKLSSQAAVGVLFARMQLIMQQLVTRIAMASSRWRCSLERGPLQYKFQAQRAWPCMISDFTCQQLAHVAQTPSTCHAPQKRTWQPLPRTHASSYLVPLETAHYCQKVLPKLEARGGCSHCTLF